MKKIVSGIQTSGSLHLGNYLGSIKNWTKLQQNNENYLFLADLHSITVPQNSEDLQNSILEVAAAYLASGIDPKFSSIFQQSDVSAHSELAWILSCQTSMGLLNRMTQFKDKSGDNKEKASLGLYSYPVLMAADILIYNADIVPVGEDQKQHLELTRDIASSFNHNFKTLFFNLPEPLITGGTRIMSLRDGTKKMSKSDGSDMARINLLDDADTITKKIKKAKSDAIENIYYDKQNRPEITNLLTIFATISDSTVESVVQAYQNKNFSKFKQDLAEVIIAKIVPISIEMKKMLNDKNHIISVLKSGADKANNTAQKNLDEVKKLVGFK